MTNGDATQEGDLLRQLRLKAGLTQAQLGEAAGMDRSWINQIETGKRRLGPKSRQRLAETLGVTTFDLGAPAKSAPRPVDRPLLDRLEELAESAAEVLRNQETILTKLAALERALEALQGPPKRRQGNT